MRIVYVTAELPFSTQEAFIIPEISELNRRGFEIMIVPRSPRDSVAHDDAEPLLKLTNRQPVLSATILIGAMLEVCRRPVRALTTLLWLLQSRNPAVLARNLAIAPKGLWLARIAREWGAAHIHAHWAATTSTMAMIAARMTDIPWSFTAHRWDIVENNLLAWKMKHASFARFISRSGLELARESVSDGLADSAQIVHMGVEIPPRRGAGMVSTDGSVVLCAANLVPVKGHCFLVEAFAILRERGVDARLLIAGDGELRESIQRQIDGLSIGDRVVMLGQLSHRALLDMYADGSVDMVVLPSVDLGKGLHEGIPVALIEAMGFGIPTVSTRTGGIPELLERGAGILVPAQNSEAVADALECLLLNPERRRQLGCAGQARVEEQFSIDASVSQLESLFTSNRTAHGHRS